MTTKRFFEYYDLEESKIHSIKQCEKGVSILMSARLYMQFIGNGFRSEFDEEFTHEFIFEGIKTNYDIQEVKNIKNVRYQNDELIFEADGKEIRLKETNVIVHSNQYN